MKTTRKGAVPIPYIIALLLGIAVVAILGYWFFVLGGQWGGEMTLDTCRTRALTYCTGWQALAYATDADAPTVGWFSENYPACDSYNTALGFSGVDGDADTDRTACENIFAATGGSGGSPTTTTSPGPTLPTP